MLDLRTLRKQRGMSVSSVARRIEVCPAQIRRYERGDRVLPVMVAQRFGAVYGVNWWELYPDYLQE